MPLPVPTLDDRRFQDIVDEAKRMIPRYCPEWTDHNVSDPGVTLIELFAWMTELLLYRVNQVPDKVYTSFLNLLGVRRAPPRSAQVPVTFYLSAAQAVDVIIPAETEVATIRTETLPSIIFTTEKDLAIRAPTTLGAYSRAIQRGEGPVWTTHNLAELDLPNRKLSLFQETPAPGDCFYLVFDKDLSHHILALVVRCAAATGEGVDPRNPPFVWEVWQAGATRWAPCRLEHDGTGGFNYAQGEMILHLPTMASEELQGIRGYWLRCRLTEAQGLPGGYQVSPAIHRLRIESRGATVTARHAVSIRNEVMGRSEGTPGQTFRFAHTPLLARDETQDFLWVEPPGMPPEKWTEVADFSSSGAQDKHYTVDAVDGTLTFGPTLPQPDGRVYCFGAIPPRGSVIRFSRYQYGGGILGNVPAGALSVVKTSIPYVSRVHNAERAEGGLDAQSLEDAKLTAPRILRARNRAVTADDYEYLACEVPGVARACCLAPGAQPAVGGEPAPGQVNVMIVPTCAATKGRIPLEKLVLSAELRAAALSHLEQRRPLGIRVDVKQAQYVWVSVAARIRLQERGDPALKAEMQALAEDALYRYLNPYLGGPGGTGWPFGRDMFVAELYGVLQQLPSIEFVEALQVAVVEPGSATPPRQAPPRLTVPAGSVICSHLHRVSVV